MSADNYRDTLITIVEKSATLAERLSGEFVPINDPTEAEIIEARLNTWIQTAAQGDPERFHKRLEWDGLTLEQVKPLLGSVRRRDPNAPLPRWAELLGEIFEVAETLSLDKKRGTVFTYDESFPFAEIFLPFLKVAQNHFYERMLRGVSYRGKWSPPNHLNGLLRALSEISVQTLMVVFKTFQIMEYGAPLSEKTFPKTSTPTRDRYLAFIKAVLDNELKSICIDYAVLARLLATTTLYEIEGQLNILFNLFEDVENLREAFGFLNRDYLPIQSFDSRLSDPHNNHQTVALVAVTLDITLFKPRTLGIDKAFNNLLLWRDQRRQSPKLKTPITLDYGDHGWVELLPSNDYGTRETLGKYYYQMGLLLGSIQMLAGNDCHSDNIISHIDYDNNTLEPVLVDAETLMHHRVPDIEYHFPDARAEAHKIIENSVLRTQVLPRWEFGSGSIAYDMSALGSFEKDETDLLRPIWKNINTDVMYLGSQERTMDLRLKPYYEGLGFKYLNPVGYESEIIGGFTEMYRFLMTHRDELLAEGSPLEGFKNQRVRYVFRPTQTYQTVLQHTLQPRYLHEGIDRSIQIESLNRVLLAWDEKPIFWDIHKGEAQAMEQMDVPLLTYNSSETSLHIGDITIENVFDRPAYTLVIERLNSMSEDDLQQQITFIRGSLFCRITHELPDTDDEIPIVLQNAPTLPRELLISEASQIADELQARAIWGEDGSATWITLTYHFAANRYQFGQISDGLYDGVCGVAFFLAALHHVAGWPGARELALAAIKPLQNRLYHPVLSQRLARNLGVNGPSGLKSIAYALRHISEWLNEPDLLDDVRLVESLISPERAMAEQKVGRIPENVFAQAAGRWRITTHLPEGVQLWGLYGGRAGIGYELLKLLNPNLPPIPF
ncbi:MAG: hypothetical protein BroJett018_01940 [Chloroflexota bacterium]|nr:type 2 lantipeptide synthetase LanM [Chloroflexota bacterium]NOG62014.1 type 2 lantipeptide synthetase LanM [Chloroflexota bacterium]GIK62400.1 MAG: hypothetical protein BroJett018_01940 [Chloroflexota bacterium]